MMKSLQQSIAGGLVMSFGRKGLVPGKAAHVAARPPLGSAASSRHEAVAPRRDGFNAPAAAGDDRGLDTSADPLAGLRNGVVPATRRDEPVGQHWSPLPEAERQRARASGYASVRKDPDKRFLFGEPHKRSLALAYVFWFIAGQGSLHRFYCGQNQSAIMQIGLLVGSVLFGLVYVPIAVAGIFAWFFWIVADLFLIPRMMRQFKAEYAPDYGGVFA
jgi:hypothetical protein